MKSFFSKFLLILAIIIIIIIAIILAIPSGGTSLAAGSAAVIGISSAGLVVAGTTLGVGTLALIAVSLVVLAFIIDPKGTSETLGKVADGIGSVLGKVGRAVGKGVSGLFEGLGLGNILLLGLGGYLAITAIKGGDSSNDDHSEYTHDDKKSVKEANHVN